MRAALVSRQGMDLIDDDRPHRAQHLPAAPGCEQYVKRLWRGHQNVRRLAEHRRPLALRRVASANQHADLRKLRINGGQLAKRALQVLLDVVA
jgi:hypothetical protein